jgi:SAM-dependent methyltransferase
MNTVKGSAVWLDQLAPLMHKPELFAPGAPLFWNDPHISEQMLAAHLDPRREAASRPHAVIDEEAGWLVEWLDLHPGDPVLDLGCGPGLYCARLAAHGLEVTGIDYSERSIAHARDHARAKGLSIRYRCEDYLTLEEREAYSAILLIYGDFCVLSDEERAMLLARVARALRPGGRFAFDMTTPVSMQSKRAGRRWSLEQGGFWRAGRHLVLSERLTYPEESVSLDQCGIVEEDGTVTVYRLWLRHYTPESIRPLLADYGLAVVYLGSNLRGGAYHPSSEWLGVIAQRRA